VAIVAKTNNKTNDRMMNFGTNLGTTLETSFRRTSFGLTTLDLAARMQKRAGGS
jgi:hypothetical protein